MPLSDYHSIAASALITPATQRVIRERIRKLLRHLAKEKA
jgi:hypothetical protein